MEIHDIDERLFDAVDRNDIDNVNKLLAEGADPNARKSLGFSPLHTAAKAGHFEVAELLLDYGSDPDAKDNNGSTPLHNAAEQGCVEVVQLLLDRWADREAENNERNTPLHLASDDRELTLLLLGKEPEPSKSDKNNKKPMFPITINGNHLDETMTPTITDLKTRYILVQSRTPLSPLQAKRLEEKQIKLQEYVSKNTYLCKRQGAEGLDEIYRIAPIAYVDVYRAQFKISSDIRESPLGLDREIHVDVIFHHDVELESSNIQALVVQSLHKIQKDIRFCPDKAQLVIWGQHLEKLAAIDQVRQIEEATTKIELHNNHARLVLERGNAGQGSGEEQSPTQHAAFRGEGQVIAIADSGINKKHPAFAGRQIIVYTSGQDEDEDKNGHGTHVCGSAVGDSLSGNLTPRMVGTAPQAGLVVQSLAIPGTRKIMRPESHYELFRVPYIANEARVHSNSWLSESRASQGAYTGRAEAIDQFVWKHKDMVICWAAGNEMEWTTKPSVREEAMAKNCITVGASENHRRDDSTTYNDIMENPGRLPGHIRQRCIAGNPDLVAAFSARGPTQGRVKPDVVAPGTRILSARSSTMELPPTFPPGEDQLWRYSNGTSMATPLVAGCAALLREALVKRQYDPSPSAALIKALLVNGADILDDSQHSGFGRVNLSNSMEIACAKPGSGIFEAEHDKNGHNKSPHNVPIKVGPGRSSLKVTLVWSDPPGKMTQNCMRLTLKGPGESRRQRIDEDHNVQQMLRNNVPEGEVIISVQPGRRLWNDQMQPFAVVWRLWKKPD